MKPISFLPPFLPLVLIAASAQADPTDPHANLGAVARAAAAFAGEPVTPPDPGLRLAACPLPLALSWYGMARDSVLVQCPAPAGWRLFVALERSGGAAQLQTPAIVRGDPVSIVLGDGSFSVSQPGEAMEGGPIGGWIRVRTLSGKGQALRARVLRPGQVGIPLP